MKIRVASLESVPIHLNPRAFDSFDTVDVKQPVCIVDAYYEALY